MAVLQDNSSGALAGVDSAFRALRVAQRPPATLSANIGVGISGSVTGIAANANLFSFRNLGTNLIAVRRVFAGWLTTTAFTTAQQVDLKLLAARAFTVSDSSGTAVTFSGNDKKLKTSLATLTSTDCRVAAAAGLTAGTRTLDTDPLGVLVGWSSAAGQVQAIADLINQPPGAWPLVLAQNEGFVVQAITAFGAAGVVKFYIGAEIAEVSIDSSGF